MHDMENLSEILGDVLTTKEVAERLNISVAKVHRLILSRALTPDFKVDGTTGRYYFRADAIEAYASATDEAAAS